MLNVRQEQFLNFLLNEDTQISTHISEQGNISVDVRLNIYRNAYHMRLKETIETDHEILGMYLGDELFDDMVARYTQTHPSNFRSLRDYANQLPDFLACTPPFSNYPIISELAAFERRLLSAFDARDVERMTMDTLVRIPPEEWPELCFTFHPSMQIFYANWNSVDAWQALKAGTSPDPEVQMESIWLLWRNDELLTEFKSMSIEEHTLIQQVLKGADFSVLCDTLLQVHAEEVAGQIAVQYVSSWIGHGLLSSDSNGLK